MAVTIDEVRKVAQLAKLRFTEDEMSNPKTKKRKNPIMSVVMIASQWGNLRCFFCKSMRGDKTKVTTIATTKGIMTGLSQYKEKAIEIMLKMVKQMV